MEAPVKERLLEEGGRWVDSILLAIDDDQVSDEASFDIVKVSEWNCYFKVEIYYVKLLKSMTCFPK